MSMFDPARAGGQQARSPARGHPGSGGGRGSSPRSRASWIHSTRLHLVLYSFLLVATPFLLLRNFLVELIGEVSSARMTVFGVSLPVVATLAGAAIVLVLVALCRKITRWHVVAALVVALMDAAAQQITDYYFGHNFYDLQQNWHYIAYGLFAVMVYRDLAPRGYRLARIMLLTGCCALAFSTFDESFQMHMSNRVFDVGDIAKDVWGSLMGMVAIYVGGPRGHELLEGNRGLRQRRLRDYLNQPLAMLVWMIIGGFVFICVSALLTEVEYLWIAVTVTVGTFVAVFVIVHLTQFRWSRRVLAVVLVAALGTQAYSIYRQRDAGISYACPNLTVYRGIPLPLFDLMFFADGSIRPVDKKHLFNNRDQRTLLRYRPDILVVGAGFEGRGGNGFPDKTGCLFIYSDFIKRGTQVFILPTPQACDAYNRLRREHRNVLFVLHSGC